MSSPPFSELPRALHTTNNLQLNSAVQWQRIGKICLAKDVLEININLQGRKLSPGFEWQHPVLKNLTTGPEPSQGLEIRGGARSTVVDTICPPGWDRVNCSAKKTGGHLAPQAPHHATALTAKNLTLTDKDHRQFSSKIFRLCLHMKNELPRGSDNLNSGVLVTHKGKYNNGLGTH